MFQVVLARYNRKENFIAGIVSTLLYIYVFYQYKLFAESALNSYYLLISIAGLFYWKETQQPIAHWHSNEKIITGGIIIFGGSFLYLVLKNYTSSTVPMPDAIVSAVAWAGSWLLLKRKVENWVVLNISNVLAIPLLLYKGLSLTALLTLIYIYVAILGYQAWKKEIQ